MNRLWVFLAGFLILGYVCFGRAFSYLGIPAAHLFIGEIALAVFLLIHGRAIVDHWYTNLEGRGHFGALAWSLVAFVCYGAFQVAHGLYGGYTPLTVIESVAFHIYPLYLFIGLYTGVREPLFLRKIVLWVAWWNCVYGMAYILALHRLTVSMPGTAVSAFSGAGGGSLVILGLLSFEPRLARLLLPFVINMFLLLAMQVRAEWLGFTIGLFVWGVLSRRAGRLAFGVAAVVVLLAAGYAADFSIPAPATRGGNVSFSDIASRALASVDSEKAREFSASAGQFAGTVAWRTTWWNAIWDSVHSNPTTTVFGHGYGYPLNDLVTFLKNTEIRTPHSVFFYALGYGGWVGVIVFFAFQIALGGALWRTYSATGQPFGFVLWLVALVSGFLGNVFETPFGAIPLYLLAGAALAPGVAVETPDYESEYSEQGIFAGGVAS